MSAELVVALDHLNPKEALTLVEDLRAAGVNWFKVGLELFIQGGPSVVQAVKAQGARIFLDLKLFDIPNTIAQAVQAAAGLQVDLLTIHCMGGTEMMEAGAKAAKGSSLQIVGVTVLTSAADSDLNLLSSAFVARAEARSRSEVAQQLAKAAAQAGLDGVVCSVPDLESGAIQSPFSKKGVFVTPGIRPKSRAGGVRPDDQKSVADPSRAVAAGATHLVVGRPILFPESGTRQDVARAILRQLH